MKPQFGKIALKLGYINETQMNEALDIQQKSQEGIGMILVHMNAITPGQVKQVIEKQRSQTVNQKLWGECALDLGFVTREDLENAVKLQRNSSEVLGQILVDLGYMTDIQREEVHNRQIASAQRDKLLRELKDLEGKWFAGSKRKEILRKLDNLS